MATDDDYRSYRGAIAAVIQVLRPYIEVDTVNLDGFDERLERFDPHVVICTLPVTTTSGERLAWVQLSLDPLRPSVFCVRGRYSEQTNPALDSLIAVIDDVEKFVETRDGAAEHRA